MTWLRFRFHRWREFVLRDRGIRVMERAQRLFARANAHAEKADALQDEERSR